MLSTWASEGLRLGGPTNFTMVGLLQAANGNYKGTDLYFSGVGSTLPPIAGLDEVQEVALGLLNISDAAEMAVMEIDERSLIMKRWWSDRISVSWHWLECTASLRKQG